MEKSQRKPAHDDFVLVHPETGTPMTRQRLYHRMIAVGKRAGVENAHPHRFRDTFAVDVLARGASPYDVAKLLGDTIQTVEKHYAAFVRELGERVRRMMVDHQGLAAFASETPESHGENLASILTKEV